MPPHRQVTNPVKQGEGVAAFVSYSVRTKTTHRDYAQPFAEVGRRFRDFAWLHDKLAEKNKVSAGHVRLQLPSLSVMCAGEAHLRSGCVGATAVWVYDSQAEKASGEHVCRRLGAGWSCNRVGKTERKLRSAYVVGLECGNEVAATRRNALLRAVQGHRRPRLTATTGAGLVRINRHACRATQGVIVPPLPEKSAVQKYQMATEFIDTRRRALQVCGAHAGAASQ